MHATTDTPRYVYTGRPLIEGIAVAIPTVGTRIASRPRGGYDATVAHAAITDDTLTVRYLTDDGEAGTLTYRVRKVA